MLFWQQDGGYAATLRLFWTSRNVYYRWVSLFEPSGPTWWYPNPSYQLRFDVENLKIWFWDNQCVACFQFVGHEIARESSFWVEQWFSIFSDMHGAAGDGWRTPGLRVEHSRMSLSTMKTAYWLTGRHTRGPSFWWFWVVAVRLYEHPNVTKMFSFIINQCRVE